VPSQDLAQRTGKAYTEADAAIQNSDFSFPTSALIEALERNHGKVVATCEDLGCATATFYYRLKIDKEFAEAVARIRETRIDKAESKLDEALDRGEPYAVSLVLKTLGRHRGYVERVEGEKSTNKLYTNNTIIIVEHSGEEDDESDVIDGEVSGESDRVRLSDASGSSSSPREQGMESPTTSNRDKKNLWKRYKQVTYQLASSKLQMKSTAIIAALIRGDTTIAQIMDDLEENPL